MSVSFSGELAYEIHVPMAQLRAAYDALRTAGERHGLRPFGSRARVESMRLEKGYRHWKADLVTEFTPFESGLARFVDLEKPAFVGKAALAGGPRRTRAFVSLEIDATHAPAQGGDSIVSDGRIVVGTVTSAGWGHRVGKNLAMGFVEPGVADVGTRLRVEIVGEATDATRRAGVSPRPGERSRAQLRGRTGTTTPPRRAAGNRASRDVERSSDPARRDVTGAFDVRRRSVPIGPMAHPARPAFRSTRACFAHAPRSRA